jgi:signal transduction histidine kinase/ligand-binding sensor domain-containing protein
VELEFIPKKLTLFFLLLTVVISISKAQTEYRFEKITVEDGLSQSSITSLIQDDFGYLWIGTLNGLNKYDGKHFTVYKHDEAKPSSIRANLIRKLFLDRQKHLWVVFAGALARYLPQFDSFENIPLTIQNEDLSKTTVHSVTNLTDSSFIICSSNGLIGYSIPQKKFYRIAALKQFNHLDVERYLNTPKLGEWIFCLNKTIMRFNGQKQWTTILNDTRAIAHYYDAKANEIYLQTKSNLYRYNSKIKKLLVIDTYDGIDFDPHNFGMIKRSNGTLWVYRKEIYIYNSTLKREATLAHLAQNPFSLSGKYISCLYESQDGVVWVGTNGFGLNKYNPNTAVFKLTGAFYGAPISLSENYISAVYTADDNELYVGTTVNVDNINLKKSKSQPIQIKTTFGIPTRVNKFFAENDKLWLCTDNGLKYIQNDTAFPSDIPLLADNSLKLSDCAQIGAGRYVLAGNSGTYLWDNQKRTAKKINYRASRPICLFNKKIWLDVGDSVILIDPNTGKVAKKYLKSVNNNTGMPLTSIPCFYKDSENNLWIGSWGSGLILYDSIQENFLVFKEKHGLPDLVVYAILEDDSNNLWLGTNKGLSVFDKRKRRVIRNYTKEDGLQGNEFNTRAAHKSKSGILYFGGVNGLTYFRPDEVLKIEQAPPKAVLKGFYINHVRVDTMRRGIDIRNPKDPTIDLMWGENSFDIELSSLNYTLAVQTRYKYFLENYDTQWYDIDDRSFISFVNVPAGNYLLRIKAYTAKGAIQKEDLILHINIHQPFWRNKDSYFYALAVLLFLLALIYKIRTNSLRRKTEQLSRLVSERTKELQAMNEEMATQNEEISAQNEEISAQNEEITLHNETLAEIRMSLEQTVEKRTATLMELNAKLEAQNSQLEQFAFITAHNIRGPVASIKGLVSLLPSQSIEVDYLRIAVQNLDDLIVELNDILDIQLNTDDNKFEPVKLKEVLLRVISTFKDEIRSRDATIDTSQFDECQMPGFKSYFNSIFYNLLSNALKYTDPLRKQTITFTCTTKEGQLRIRVSDVGLGIDMKYTQGKIFNMYQRFHPEIQGKGFGLFLVRSQIEAMNGKIVVESEVGKGTTFTITF